jgi:hypothetical protein
MYETAMALLNANLRRGGFLADAVRSPLYRADEQVKKLRDDPTTDIPSAGGPRDAGGAGAVLNVRLADPQPAGPVDPAEPTPVVLRGPTRTLLHADRDDEVRVAFVDVPKSPQVFRYVVRDALGGLVTSGVVQAIVVARVGPREAAGDRTGRGMTTPAFTSGRWLADAANGMSIGLSTLVSDPARGSSANAGQLSGVRGGGQDAGLVMRRTHFTPCWAVSLPLCEEVCVLWVRSL